MKLRIFLTSELFQQNILVCYPDWIDEVRNEIPQDLKTATIDGGSPRRSSFLLRLQARKTTEYVMIYALPGLSDIMRF